MYPIMTIINSIAINISLICLVSCFLVEFLSFSFACKAINYWQQFRMPLH